jgi:hypothetical protein
MSDFDIAICIVLRESVCSRYGLWGKCHSRHYTFHIQYYHDNEPLDKSHICLESSELHRSYQCRLETNVVMIRSFLKLELLELDRHLLIVADTIQQAVDGTNYLGQDILTKQGPLRP